MNLLSINNHQHQFIFPKTLAKQIQQLYFGGRDIQYFFASRALSFQCITIEWYVLVNINDGIESYFFTTFIISKSLKFSEHF